MTTATKSRTRASQSSTSKPRESLGAKSVRWIERLLVHGEGDLLGHKVKLRPDQRLFLFQWQELDEDGGWWFDEGYVEAPSGVGKTQELAWTAAEAFAGPTATTIPAPPNVIVQANSREQAGEKKGDDTAEGIFGRIVQVLTHPNCPLRDHVRVLEDRIVFADGRPGRIRLIPAKGSTTDGGLPTLYIGDEVQDWTGQAYDAYVRNSKSTTKTRMSRTLSGSTPGAFAGLNSVGWDLHQRGERGDDPRFLYRKLAAPPDLDVKDEAALRAALVACNPGISSHRLDRLVRRAAQIPLADYKRFHLGLWVEADRESWLADHPGAWERCESVIAIPEGAPVTVGVDIGLNRDSMSVTWCWRNGAQRVVRARIWTPEPDRAVDIKQARLFISGELSIRQRVEQVAYDPRQFAESAAELADENVRMLEIPQTVERLSPADGHLYDLILGELIAHDGDHDFTQQVNAAVKRPTERGWYLSKGRTKRHMDACRALSLAVAAADLWADASNAPADFFVI
jgi:phage terminase large subunit-like protein